ncbi:hypothetical protein AVEN_87288-1 [Araneus ventricosus]|uniref:Uncharacterized protein n=1 Tax=Araneus ventricosus TaxID=182803 RepID=A0A4Y2EBJ3_ARAVE|nr:hypothetical protein AVEN_87288-1 [Araneus ventricosus]
MVNDISDIGVSASGEAEAVWSAGLWHQSLLQETWVQDPPRPDISLACFISYSCLIFHATKCHGGEDDELDISTSDESGGVARASPKALDLRHQSPRR